MNNFSEIVLVITAITGITTILKNLNELVPAPSRRKMIAGIGEFADSNKGIRFNNSLVTVAIIGIVISGTVMSVLIMYASKFSIPGIFSGLLLQTFTIAFAMFFRKTGYRR